MKIKDIFTSAYIIYSVAFLAYSLGAEILGYVKISMIDA